MFALEESTRKKYWSDKKMMNSCSQLQMGQQNCQEETTNSQKPLKGRNNLWGVKNLSGELQGEPDSDLDVMQEERVDDCWNVDSNRSLSVAWKGFTKFTLLKEKPPKRIYVVREETDEDSSDHQTRLRMARSLDENWKSRSKS